MQQLVADMFETMYAAHGVGLAAPQIGNGVRLFVMDSGPMVELDEEDLAELADRGEAARKPPVKRAFINPVMVSETGEEWGFEEGCLSIPGVRELVLRRRRHRAALRGRATASRTRKPFRAWPPASFSTSTTTSKACCSPTSSPPSRSSC
ncbi:MAG: peptide deformylase [Hymenobacter sp.]